MTTTNTTAREIGTIIGQAIARDVIANDDLSREWTGIEDQDGDQLTAAGIEPGTAEWSEAEESAEEAYTARLAKRTYRVGELKNGTRELYIAETQEVVARVESDLGPAMIGDMTEEQARRRFPEAFGDDR